MTISPPRIWQRGEYSISTETERLDLPLIYDYLSHRSYWGRGRSLEIVRRSIKNSVNFGVFHLKAQVGFARVVTDFATFAWLADVFILEDHRRQGLGKWLLETIVTLEELQGLRHWLLATHDAQGLYRRYGFTSLRQPEHWMEKSTQ